MKFAQIFSNIRKNAATTVEFSPALSFEIFDTFQRLRWPLLRWLQTHREECNTVMEAVVRTITFANEGHADRAISQAVKARAWESLTEPVTVLLATIEWTSVTLPPELVLDLDVCNCKLTLMLSFLCIKN